MIPFELAADGSCYADSGTGLFQFDDKFLTKDSRSLATNRPNRLERVVAGTVP